MFAFPLTALLRPELQWASHAQHDQHRSPRTNMRLSLALFHRLLEAKVGDLRNPRHPMSILNTACPSQSRVYKEAMRLCSQQEVDGAGAIPARGFSAVNCQTGEVAHLPAVSAARFMLLLSAGKKLVWGLGFRVHASAQRR